MTRTFPLWALFFVVATADVALAMRRGVSAARLVATWLSSSLLLWGGAGLFGYLGSRITYDPKESGGFIGNPSGLPGLIIGAPIGALIGALLGIALSERALHKRWPRWSALALAALTLAVGAGMVLFLLEHYQSHEQQAGKSVLVVFPLLGAAAVLGWLVKQSGAAGSGHG